MGTNGPVWDAAWGGEVTKAGEPVTGGRRRRGTRKGGKKSRRSTRRRGGDDGPINPPRQLEAPPSQPWNPPRQLEAPPSQPWNPPRQLEAPKGGKKTRKGGKKSRKGSKKMRGGGSVGVVGAAFTGSGSRGIADYQPYASNLPPGGAFAIPTGTR